MGAVLRAHDPAMDRVLAVKVVLPEYRGDPAMTRRFLGEARLAGQLQHPGVVPVHDLGHLDDGRPFFAMKLIEGRTLAQLLRERPGPGHDLPRFLRYFQAVCQAVGYAHSQGVIHRDLKPANVMVGAFGEVQVMDWGLARRLGERPTSCPPSSRPDEPGGSPRTTRAGAMLGTPAYMAPEQASGEVERLDERSDVFGLGAILCELLTGQPPYVGKDEFQVHRRAARAELGDAQARLNGCGADAGLVELALACLASQPADRPRDGQAMAESLTVYLDGVQARLREAEVAEAEARARAAGEARRRRLAVALAGTVLLAVTLGAGIFLRLQADRQARQARVTREVTEALNEVATLRDKARAGPADSAALFARAREQAQRALTLVQAGPAAEALQVQVRRVKGELDEEEKDRQFLAAVDAARLAQAETEVGQNRFTMERAVALFREAFRAYGLPAGQGDPAAAAARLRQRPPPVREAVSAALGEWIDLATNPQLPVREPHLDWLHALAAAGPDQKGTAEIRAAWQEKDPGKRRAALEKLAAEADVRRLPAPTLTALARWVRACCSTDSAVRLLRRARQHHPGDFWINEELGTLLRTAEPQRWEGAVRYLTAAVSLRPDSAGAHVNLGAALEAGRQFDEAIACFRKAIELKPKYVTAHFNLGRALASAGKPQKAIASFRTAVAIDPNFVLGHYGLGCLLAELGKVDEAVVCYRKVLELDPKHFQAHNNLALALKRQNKIHEAVASFRRALDINPHLPEAHLNLGYTLLAQKKLPEAVSHLGRGVELMPGNADAHHTLGLALMALREGEEAAACFRKAVKLAPENADAHCNLGYALEWCGDFAEALAAYRRGHELGSRRADWKRPSAQWVSNCERLVEREKHLLRVLAGEHQPTDARERLDWARLCGWTGRYAAAARLSSEAFAVEAKLADDLKLGSRYLAATAAAQAAAGKGRDASGLDDGQKADLRKQALRWLKADLAARARQPAGERAAALRVWQAERALAAVRGEQALRALPEEERAAWADFWTEVQRHLRDKHGG
jgi:serine/threonine-protein kinase